MGFKNKKTRSNKMEECKRSVQKRFDRIKDRVIKKLPLTKKEIRFFNHYENSKFNTNPFLYKKESK